MIPFDPIGPLPTGTIVLEASAGTGKTHAIAALAVRYLAEGITDAGHLAVISFSRLASAELRSRVRDRLGQAIAALRGQVEAPTDPTDLLLARGPAEAVAARLARLQGAAADLDQAGIMTIHQFCQAMLDELGVLAGVDPHARLVEDLSALRDEVVDDLYLARYARDERGAPFDLATARLLALEADTLLDTPLVPAGADGLAGERIGFATAVRAEFAERKLQSRVYTFDDQLLRLRDVLRGPNGAACAARLRRRCVVVLVDEFQDTDPVQWEVLRDTFSGHVPLVLIGDPKQSIYSFRGADVQAYADAVSTAEERYSLSVNHRCDQGLVTAVNAIFSGVSLGPGIDVPPVSAEHTRSRLLVQAGSPWAAPARVRCVDADRPLTAAQARAQVTADLTAQIVDLLSAGAELSTPQGRRSLVPSDIAVLVARNWRGRELAEALAAAGVAVSISGADSIFASHAAGDWLTLLRALEQPRRSAVRAAILTDFLGADLDALARAGEDQLTAWSGRLQAWARVLSSEGVAALFAQIQATAPHRAGFAVRILRRTGGERDLTDFRHLAELLHEQHAAGVRGQALVAWLEDQITRSSSRTDRLRRLETDRDAVRVMTVHKAKGLQFPVVMLPDVCDLAEQEDAGACLDFHDGAIRVLDVGGISAPGRQDRWHARQSEQAADRLRSLYVAITRAQSQATVWWSRTGHNTAASPLHRLLFRRRDVTGPPQESYPVDTPLGSSHPRELGWTAAAGISVEDVTDGPSRRLGAPANGLDRLVLLDWHRGIDALWRRTSYSGLTESVHARGPIDLTAEATIDDEPESEASEPVAAAGTPSPMADLPGGTSFGSLVHHVLENLDWYAPDAASRPALSARLLAATTHASGRFAVQGVAPQALADAMLPSLLTPLGPLTGGLALAAIPVADRLSELSFEYPLGRSWSTTTLADLAGLLRRWLPTDDPLAGYPDALATPQLSGQVLRGFLTGSIDSVVRVHGPQGPRFVVIDYKTNRLGPSDLTVEQYSRSAMADEMIRSHYPLQAMLYAVALHRFLRGRLAGYAPERHLGGVGYLFVRGMNGLQARPGPDGAVTGVFDWFPPTGLVVELSDLLADAGSR